MPHHPIAFIHAECDTNTDEIVVEGEAPAGVAACLMPRRYRKQPEWWVVEVAGIEAPTEQAQQFRLACSASGIWGSEGIEVQGAGDSVKIPRTAPEASTDAPPRKLKLEGRMLRSSDD